MFGSAIDYAKVTIRRRKWFPFHPRNVTMAPRGHMHFHPASDGYCDDFSKARLPLQAHFIHEMVHIWQAQQKGSWWLVLNRMPWASYDYTLKPGWKLEQYGIEQQAEIVKHAFMLRRGAPVPGVAGEHAYRALVDFPGAGEAVRGNKLSTDGD